MTNKQRLALAEQAIENIDGLADITIGEEAEKKIKRELSTVFNVNGVDNALNTPDYVLAEIAYDAIFRMPPTDPGVKRLADQPLISLW